MSSSRTVGSCVRSAPINNELVLYASFRGRLAHCIGRLDDWFDMLSCKSNDERTNSGKTEAEQGSRKMVDETGSNKGGHKPVTK